MTAAEAVAAAPTERRKRNTRKVTVQDPPAQTEVVVVIERNDGIGPTLQFTSHERIGRDLGKGASLRALLLRT